MSKPLYSRFLLTSMIILLLLLPSFPLVSAYDTIWDENWSYHQQIDIPIDTALPSARYQPIDIPIQFTSSCWGVDETTHSIRVCCWDGKSWQEIESQIYNLKKNDETSIQECNIVFLIPSFADGTEQYYIYYDDTEKPDPRYDDHVSISESYYRYEPISGYPLESSYYKITDDNIIPYIVSQEGQFMGYNTGQHVTKMIENATEVLPKNGDLFAAFDFKYCYENGLFDYSSTSQKLISKEIFIDGNLMISFGMVSTSKKDDLKTTVTYTYYHCPTSTTRIRAHVKHETLTDVTVIREASTDGVFASLQSGGVKSSSIEDLNIGEILPYMHFTNEFNEIVSYDLDTDPDYIPDDPDIRLVSYEDDVDLGQQPWITFNKGTQGLAHAVFFHSNQILVSGEQELDGFQLNAFQMDYPHLPGLENNIATIQIGRNSYESETGHDRDIPDDLIIEFDAEFFTSRNDGVNAVIQEAELFNTLIDKTTQSENHYDNQDTDQTTYSLSVIIKQAHSFPFGSSLSAATGLNLSYITAELYQNNTYISSESAVRIPMNALDQETETLFEKIQALIGFIDYRNISIRKKVVFDTVNPGTYTIKLFLENPLLSNHRRYIGFAEVEVLEDTRITMKGGNEQTLDFTVVDQDEETVENAEILLLQDNGIIATGFTDTEGSLELTIPGNIHQYDLVINLHGEECYRETVTLKTLQLKQYHSNITIERYNIDITIQDAWELPPGVEVTPILLNQEETSLGYAEIISDSSYQFSSLAPSIYTIILQYKSFMIEEEIQLHKDTTLPLTFPALFHVDISIVDTHGLPCSDIIFHIARDGKEEQFHGINGTIHIEVPPGQYTTKIYDDDQIIGKRNLIVNGDNNQLYVTNKEPILPLIYLIILIGSASIILYILYTKKEKLYILQILPIAILLGSLVVPWWTIQGSTSTIETTTQLFMIPSNIITVTSSSTFITGDQGYLPDLFILMINGMIGMMILSIVLMILSHIIHLKKQIYTLILYSFIILSLIGTLSVFIIGMSTLSDITVGTLIGSGDIDISLAGQGTSETIYCTWGPSIGFYLLIISIIVYIISLGLHIKKEGRGIRWKIKR